MKSLPSTEERIWAVLAHLSALVTGMGLILPVIGWAEGRNKSKYTAFQTLQALGYQSLGYTIWLLTYLVVMMFSLLLSLANLENMVNDEAEMFTFIIVHFVIAFGSLGVYFLLPVIAAISCAFGRDFRYPIMGNRLALYLEYDLGSENPLNEEHEDRWVAAMGHFAVIIALWGMLAPATAWILQGRRSLWLKFQSVQTLVFQASVLLLSFLAGAVYFFGFFAFAALIGFGDAAALNEPGGVIGFAVLLISMLVAALIVLVIPLFHITGQWAGYRVLKGDDYHYPLIGKLVARVILPKDIGTM